MLLSQYYLVKDKFEPKQKITKMKFHFMIIGSKHGAEKCELVKLYLLKRMENKTNQENIGIYKEIRRVNSNPLKNKCN